MAGLLGGLRSLLVRSHIEEILAKEGEERLSLLYLPAAFGGLLDLVRDIVTETIAHNKSAGVDTRNAEAALTRGNQEMEGGNYKKAYDAYAKAYQAVVK